MIMPASKLKKSLSHDVSGYLWGIEQARQNAVLEVIILV